MTPGRMVDRETTRRRVTGPRSGVAGAAELETAKTATALATSRMIRRDPIWVCRHGITTTPPRERVIASSVWCLRALGCVRRLALVQSAGERQADRARLGRLLCGLLVGHPLGVLLVVLEDLFRRRAGQQRLELLAIDRLVLDQHLR